MKVRPKVLINALKSILDISYPEFEVHLIDDGSTNRAEPIVRDVCSSIIDKFKFSYIENTIEQKKEQGGSLHGQYLTDAIKESDRKALSRGMTSPTDDSAVEAAAAGSAAAAAPPTPPTAALHAAWRAFLRLQDSQC